MRLFDPGQIRQMKPGEFKVYNYITSHMEEIPKISGSWRKQRAFLRRRSCACVKKPDAKDIRN